MRDGVFVCGVNVPQKVIDSDYKVKAAAITRTQRYIGKAGHYTATVDWRT